MPQEKENLPSEAVQNAIAKTAEEQNLSVLLKIQKFQKHLHKKPKEEDLQTHQGAKYLPIAFMENMLDEMFFGQWSVRDFKWEVVFNEVVGSLEIEFLHPISGHWLRRTGAASIVITQKANTDLIEFQKYKQKNALDNQFPALKSLCFRNACLSIGKSFGRDVNRKHYDEYDPMIKEKLEVTNEMLIAITQLNTIEELEVFVDKNKAFHGNTEFMKEVTAQRKKISQNGTK